MEYLLYIFRFIYRIRWWLLLGPIIIGIAVVFATKNLPRKYTVKATLYTGVVSGYTIEGENGATNYAATFNAMDNLINLIKAESTLKRVSNRLYARNMIHGDLERDNEFITAASFREIYNRTKNNKDGKTLLSLIDKTSEEKTVENLKKYERPDKNNFVYGLFNWNHWHYSFGALKNIEVTRKNNSDLLEVSYSSNDPGIAFNTINILMEEFVNEYRNIRYGETDKVINYFKSELERIGNDLRTAEDSLTQYNIEKRIINYYDETREVAGINSEFELREQTVQLAYNSSKALIIELEKRMDNNMKQLQNNASFVNKLNEASTLTGKISELETFSSDKKDINNTINNYKKRLEQTTNELSDISSRYVENKITKEGIAKSSIIEQWLEQVLIYEKAKSDLAIMKKSREDLHQRYEFFAPVGSTIKRKERNINFTEQNYLSVLKSYNDALMRKKNLEMTSATLKVLNPPAFPIQAEPSERKKIVLTSLGASLILIIGFFMLIEFLDQTLRDRIRTELLTGCKVLGAFPGRSILKYRNYDNASSLIATKYLSSSILGYFGNRNKDLIYIVNFLSSDPKEGKSHIINHLESYWLEMGIKVRKLTWGIDFDINSSRYMLAQSVKDLYTPGDEDILIIEYPNLKSNNVSSKLLQEADLNLMVVRANRAWKETDKIILNRIKNQLKDAPLQFYLNKTSRNVVEGFTGMLPPYSYYRKLVYRLMQLGLTEKDEQT